MAVSRGSETGPEADEHRTAGSLVVEHRLIVHSEEILDAKREIPFRVSGSLDRKRRPQVCAGVHWHGHGQRRIDAEITVGAIADVHHADIKGSQTGPVRRRRIPAGTRATNELLPREIQTGAGGVEA